MLPNRWSLFAAIALSGASSAAAATCESLASLKLPDTTITLAQTVAAGAFTMPGAGFMPSPVSPKSLPAFCRVAATLRPSKDSDIKIEVWRPAELGWGLLAGGKEPSEIGMAQFRDIVYHDPNWDWRTLDYDKGVALADKVDNTPSPPMIPTLSSSSRMAESS